MKGFHDSANLATLSKFTIKAQMNLTGGSDIHFTKTDKGHPYVLYRQVDVQHDAKISQRRRKYTKICNNSQTFAEVCQHLLRFALIC